MARRNWTTEEWQSMPKPVADVLSTLMEAENDGYDGMSDYINKEYDDTWIIVDQCLKDMTTKDIHDLLIEYLNHEEAWKEVADGLAQLLAMFVHKDMMEWVKKAEPDEELEY